MNRKTLEHKLNNLPTKPGVYLFKNEAGEFIYVGKAVNLKNRVRSYFQKSLSRPAKVQVMAEQVFDLEYIITDSEVEALILENNLIKKHAPWYNVRLKDDKTYPYIKVTVQEDFPRVFMVRKRLADGARYFGPYTDVAAVRNTLSFLRTLFPIRSCRKNITEGSRERPCLNYHIGRCLAPCAGFVSKEKYGEMIDEVILFLEGRIDRLVPELTARMLKAAENLEFEKAARIRNQIQDLETIAERQKIVAEHKEDQDFLGYAREGELACVQVFLVRRGKLIGREHFLLDCSATEEAPEILRGFIQQFYEEASYIPREIYLPAAVEQPELLEKWLGGLRGGRVYLRRPQRGEKKHFIDLVMKNAEAVLREVKGREEHRRRFLKRAQADLQKLLDLKNPPRRIEAFDVSNIHGSYVVASLVVWENGSLKTDDYRRFRIRGLKGRPDDYEAMREVVSRRFKRGLQEQESGDEGGKFASFPQAVLIDGGKGQLGAALEIKAELGLKMPFLALAEKREEIYLAGRSQPVLLSRDAPGLLLLRQIRDEAHRFALSYHRNLRRKGARRSLLDDIPGVGPKRKKALIQHFGTVTKIRQASVEDLCGVKGISKKLAEEIYRHLQEG
ncbi:MAG TPA: excinuclease ABC subunit UvrC [Firmicutes bacterium]|nr:excinuclease ABC subunit UvrC [Bacillota bacterium]